MVLLMKMEKYSVKIGLGYFAVSTKIVHRSFAAYQKVITVFSFL